MSIGLSLPRVDGRAKVTGAARYAAEFSLPGQLHAVPVNAAVGLGRITAIHEEPVLALPGVVAVLSHKNAPRLAYRSHKGSIDPAIGERIHMLQDDRVHFYGQAVALVLAETLDTAEQAAKALRIDYEAVRPLVDQTNPQARTIVPQSGAAGTARGDADAGLAAAIQTVDAVYEIARENHNPMEPHATLAHWDGDQLTLWSKSQYVANEQAEITAIFGLPPGKVRVICPFVGGAFGTSLRTWPHVTLAAMAAKMTERPVKLVLTRKQMFFNTGHRPRTQQRIAVGADAEGRLTSLIHEGTGETSRHEEFVEALTNVSRYLYSCPNVRTSYRLSPLDTGTPTFMRGPGEASGIFALECAMDELSYKLGLDPIELRRRNEPKIDEQEGKPFSSRSLLQCYDLAARAFGWPARNPEPRSMRDGRLLIGMGMASATYPAYHAPSDARARLMPDGSAEIEVSASDMGPGTYTSMTQVAAEALGLPIEKVRVNIGDTTFPAAPSHGGSWTMASVGSAIRAACIAVQEKAKASNDRCIEATASSQRDPDIAKRYSMHAFGAVFAEISIDPDVGTIRVRRALGAYGAGRIVNPRLAASQCTGGMIGGIGMALMERTVLDARDGRPVNAHMGDYLVPVNLDISRVEALFVDENDPHVNPLGVKGLGEIALVGMAPAVANAVFHATGKRIRELPIRIEHVL
ncbi:xanthine dehydrogenase family protein molybdopterin-binding subunit [Bradyrhizobium sp. DASA03007]|uniref:xanthine dehydrogenase family protein molybdopterin-binding subunit n=1 Tax=unclassified Bradyrhizobium TaxID=2631580 RepID=UPI003F7153D7